LEGLGAKTALWTAGETFLKEQGLKHKNQGLFHKVEGHFCDFRNCGAFLQKGG
jgi:hypothetical protein